MVLWGILKELKIYIHPCCDAIILISVFHFAMTNHIYIYKSIIDIFRKIGLKVKVTKLNK